jgi:conjugal transfer pilus assembly protein TraK
MPLSSTHARGSRRMWACRSRALLVTMCAACTLPLHALQVLEARDGVAVEAIVSIKEPTRIRIEGAPIIDVVGNVHSSNCSGSTLATSGTAGVGPSLAPSINPAGEFVLECDRDRGEIYLRPVGDGGKPINLFISSAQATYTLLLRRADTPADTIVIRDRTARAAQPAASGSASQGPSSNHIRALKALLVAMASDRVPTGIRVEELGLPVQLWAGTQLTLVRRFEGRGLVGEKYQLQNTGSSTLVLAEQEFDREEGQVAGIAIEHHNLRPGETTNVFVIRRGSGR